MGNGLVMAAQPVVDYSTLANIGGFPIPGGLLATTTPAESWDSSEWDGVLVSMVALTDNASMTVELYHLLDATPAMPNAALTAGVGLPTVAIDHLSAGRDPAAPTVDRMNVLVRAKGPRMGGRVQVRGAGGLGTLSGGYLVWPIVQWPEGIPDLYAWTTDRSQVAPFYPQYVAQLVPTAIGAGVNRGVVFHAAGPCRIHSYHRSGAGAAGTTVDVFLQDSNVDNPGNYNRSDSWTLAADVASWDVREFTFQPGLHRVLFGNNAAVAITCGLTVEQVTQ